MVLGLAAGAFAVVWLVPSVQDAIIKRGMVGAFTKAANQPFLKDKALHILLCGTGSPMPDLTRANACAAVIAGGKVVIIDAGPGSWARLAAAGIPGSAIDTVLLTHLHSDHIGDLGEVATQSWLGGRSVPLEVYGPPAPEASEQVQPKAMCSAARARKPPSSTSRKPTAPTPISASRKGTTSCRQRPSA